MKLNLKMDCYFKHSRLKKTFYQLASYLQQEVNKQWLHSICTQGAFENEDIVLDTRKEFSFLQ